jgi:hypothetical protein
MQGHFFVGNDTQDKNPQTLTSFYNLVFTRGHLSLVNRSSGAAYVPKLDRLIVSSPSLSREALGKYILIL